MSREAQAENPGHAAPVFPRTEAGSLLASARFTAAKRELLQAIQEASSKIHAVRPAPTASDLRQAYAATLQEFSRDRGRDLYFPFLSSGLGSGPYVELADGSVKMDLITGIGINFFGHSHPELVSEMIDGLPSDVMQGNLEPGVEARAVLQTVLAKTGAQSRLKHGWLMCSGTMCNEVALKIIRQKKQPATRILAFENCFAGRSTAMQEITDNPGYRQGQPVYGEVDYLTFYDANQSLEENIELSLRQLKTLLTRYPGKFAALMIEIVQGEGGFGSAPREWYVRLFEAARAGGLAIWADEIQTFGRTGELFAYQKFGLSEYIDIATIGKMLQACMVLFTEEFNPKPGLVAGTFSGSAMALRTARRVVELLHEEGHLGPQGKTERLSRYFKDRLTALSTTTAKGRIGEVRAVGGMIGFVPFAGKMEDVKAALMKLFDLGIVAFYCGHGPYLIRMLPPLGVMTEAHIDQACAIIDQALGQVQTAAEKK